MGRRATVPLGRTRRRLPPRSGGGDPVPTLPGDYPAYYAAIARALLEGGRPPVTATEAAAALRVLEAAKLSAAEGRTVRIEARA